MKSLIVRFDDEQYQKLEYLSNLRNLSMNKTILSLVDTMYLECTKDPKIKLALESMKEFQEHLNNLNYNLMKMK